MLPFELTKDTPYLDLSGELSTSTEIDRVIKGFYCMVESVMFTWRSLLVGGIEDDGDWVWCKTETAWC